MAILNITVSVAPTEYPVDFDLVKAHLVVEHAEDDLLIEAYIESVVSQLDPPYGILGRAMVTQQLQYWAESFPSGKILKIPCPPLQSVESVKYYDSDEALQTLASGNYTVVKHKEPGYVELGSDKSWPTSLSDRKYPVQVNFTAGYGDDYESVPVNLRHWIMMSVADLYLQREHINHVTAGHNKFTLNMIENFRFYFND